MSTPEAHVTVTDNPEAHQYEIRMDGGVAGFVTYRLHPGRVELIHTEIRPELEGHGLGGRLAAEVLDDIRKRGLSVTPTCPFIKQFIAENEQYADLVAA